MGAEPSLDARQLHVLENDDGTLISNKVISVRSL